METHNTENKRKKTEESQENNNNVFSPCASENYLTNTTLDSSLLNNDIYENPARFDHLPTIENNSASQGDRRQNAVLGVSKLCLGHFSNNLHTCNQSSITARGVRVKTSPNGGNVLNFYLCSSSVLASYVEKNTIYNIITEYIPPVMNLVTLIIVLIVHFQHALNT